MDKQKVYAENEVSQDILTSDQMSKSMEHENAEAVYIKKRAETFHIQAASFPGRTLQRGLYLEGDQAICRLRRLARYSIGKEGWARVTYHRAKVKIRN